MSIGEALQSTAGRAATVQPLRTWLQRLGLSGCLPEAAWRRLPALGQLIIRGSDGAEFIIEGAEPDAVLRELCWVGFTGPEGATLRRFTHVAVDAEVVVDVGAHAGLYSLAACAASEAAMVIAVEPVPRNAAALRHHLELNGFGVRCEVVEAAASDSEGRTVLHVPYGARPYSASMDPAGFRAQAGELIEVARVSLDALLNDRSQKVDLVKIDVEGFEPEVLVGISGTISQVHPILFIECNPDGPLEAIEESLKRFGYDAYDLAGPVTGPLGTLRSGRTEAYRNVLCVHPKSRLRSTALEALDG